MTKKQSIFTYSLLIIILITLIIYTPLLILSIILLMLFLFIMYFVFIAIIDVSAFIWIFLLGDNTDNELFKKGFHTVLIHKIFKK